jgi:hypothetical protein
MLITVKYIWWPCDQKDIIILLEPFSFLPLSYTNLITYDSSSDIFTNRVFTHVNDKKKMDWQMHWKGVALSRLFVLICCWLREVALRERPLWMPVCSVTRVTDSAPRVTDSALSPQSWQEGLGRRYTKKKKKKKFMFIGPIRLHSIPTKLFNDLAREMKSWSPCFRCNITRTIWEHKSMCMAYQ